MKPSEIVRQYRQEIRQIILENHAQNPRIFGSVARGEDTESSDLDIVIDPTPVLTYFDIGAMMTEIEDRFNLKVDMATPNALPVKFREKVLSMAVPL